MTRREFLYLLLQFIIYAFASKHIVFLPVVSRQESDIEKIANKGFVFPITFPFILGESNVKR